MNHKPKTGRLQLKKRTIINLNRENLKTAAAGRDVELITPLPACKSNPPCSETPTNCLSACATMCPADCYMTHDCTY